VPNIPGIPHRRVVAAPIRAGFILEREGRRYIVLTNGARTVTIPRHDPVNGFTLGGIVQDAGLTPEQFREFL
jgi:hypothetical protein